MTLHETRENLKKLSIGSGIGIGIIIVLVVLFRVGVTVKNILYPPPVEPPQYAYDVLPSLQFPTNATDQALTYTLNTITGELPDFPDRLNVYPIVQHEPNFLNLDKAKNRADTLGFLNQQGDVVQETPLGDALYQWSETTGINRKITFDIVSFNFILESSYLSSLTVLGAQNLSNQDSAIETAKGFLEEITLLPEDIDLEKTQNPEKQVNYITYPQLYSIKNGALIPTTSLSKAQVIRVDFYQKDMEYDLNTGLTGENNTLQRIKMKLPILYPHPPYSTMSFWIASGQTEAQVVTANFVHQEISIPTDIEPTYPIKTAQEAFDELKNGEGYIASFPEGDTEILINNVYLAYYLGEEKQDYLMPIIVFEGEKGFFAYVSAVDSEWVE